MPPTLHPETRSTGTSASSSAASRPQWTRARAPPPASARPRERPPVRAASARSDVGETSATTVTCQASRAATQVAQPVVGHGGPDQDQVAARRQGRPGVGGLQRGGRDGDDPVGLAYGARPPPGVARSAVAVGGDQEHDVVVLLGPGQPVAVHRPGAADRAVPREATSSGRRRPRPPVRRGAGRPPRRSASPRVAGAGTRGGPAGRPAPGPRRRRPPGCRSMTVSRDSGRSRSSTESRRARTVALRVPEVSRASSPITAPGPSSRTAEPSTSTSSRPLTREYAASATSPGHEQGLPGGEQHLLGRLLELLPGLWGQLGHQRCAGERGVAVRVRRETQPAR